MPDRWVIRSIYGEVVYNRHISHKSIYIGSSLFPNYLLYRLEGPRLVEEGHVLNSPLLILYTLAMMVWSLIVYSLFTRGRFPVSIVYVRKRERGDSPFVSFAPQLEREVSHVASSFERRLWLGCSFYLFLFFSNKPWLPTKTLLTKQSKTHSNYGLVHPKHLYISAGFRFGQVWTQFGHVSDRFWTDSGHFWGMLTRRLRFQLSLNLSLSASFPQVQVHT